MYQSRQPRQALQRSYLLTRHRQPDRLQPVSMQDNDGRLRQIAGFACRSGFGLQALRTVERRSLCEFRTWNVPFMTSRLYGCRFQPSDNPFIDPMTRHPTAHPTLKLQKALAQFHNRPAFKTFLACVRLAAIHRLPVGELSTLLQQNRGIMSESGVIEQFWPWLERLEPRPRYRWPKPDLQSKQEPEYDTMLGNMDPFGSNSTEISDRTALYPIHDPEDPYGGFVPAMDVADLIPTWFHDKDPGIVIARYLRAFYPQSEFDAADAPASAQPRLLHPDAIDLVASITHHLAETASEDDPQAASLLELAEHCLRTPPDSGLTAHPEKAVSDALAALQAPPAARSCLISLGILESVTGETVAPMLELVSRVIASNAGVRETPQDTGATPQQNTPDVSSAYLSWKLIPRVIWCLCNAADHFQWEMQEATEASGQNAVFILAVHRCLSAWRETADKHCFRRSPISRADTARMLWCLQGVAAQAGMSRQSFVCRTHWEISEAFGHDIRLLLVPSALATYMDPLCLDPYQSNPDEPPWPADLADRADQYAFVAEHAFKQGEGELGCALLALGICLSAGMAQSGLGWNRAKLAELLTTASSSPGSAMVKEAISSAAKMLRERGDSPDSLYFESLGTLASDTLPLTRPIGQSKEQIVADTVSRVGNECWLWLPVAVKEALIDARVLYSRCHQDIPAGIHNWGALAHNYYVALELLLIQLYRPVLDSGAFRNHDKKGQPGRATLGTVVYLIHRHSRLPPDLQLDIEASGNRLHTDRKLAKLLQEALELRNAEAHGKEFLAIHLSRTMEMFLGERILQRIHDLSCTA